jgi:hypothetical protein
LHRRIRLSADEGVEKAAVGGVIDSKSFRQGGKIMSDTGITPRFCVATAVTTGLLGMGTGTIFTIFGLLYLNHSDYTKSFQLFNTDRIDNRIGEVKQACRDSQTALSAKIEAISRNPVIEMTAVAPLEKVENRVNPALKEEAVDFTDMSVQLYYTQAQSQKAVDIRKLLENHRASVELVSIKRGGKDLLPNRIYFRDSVQASAASEMKKLLLSWGIKAIIPMGKSKAKKSQVNFVVFVS